MEKCPYCGVKLIKNEFGDLVCPNCGLVEQHEEKSKDNQSYIG